MANVGDERFEGKLWRADSGGAGLRRALALQAVAFVTAVARKILFAVLCVSSRRRVGSRLLSPRRRACEEQYPSSQNKREHQRQGQDESRLQRLKPACAHFRFGLVGGSATLTARVPPCDASP